MWVKALFLLARYFRRIALALEGLRELYELDLQSRGIVRVRPGVTDEVEVMYGPKHKAPEEEWG